MNVTKTIKNITIEKSLKLPFSQSESEFKFKSKLDIELSKCYVHTVTLIHLDMDKMIDWKMQFLHNTNEIEQCVKKCCSIVNCKNIIIYENKCYGISCVDTNCVNHIKENLKIIDNDISKITNKNSNVEINAKNNKKLSRYIQIFRRSTDNVENQLQEKSSKIKVTKISKIETNIDKKIYDLDSKLICII